MAKLLENTKIAMLATDGFEQSELEVPKKSLHKEGAQVEIISLKTGKIKGWKDKNWGDEFDVDVGIKDANHHHYKGLILPGGVINPDRLRLDEDAINFIKAFIKDNKPIAAICHGPWTLINAEGVRGKTLTSWPSIKMDLINAGAQWVDKEVVRDGNLITSRMPGDIPAFIEEIIKIFSK